MRPATGATIDRSAKYAPSDHSSAARAEGGNPDLNDGHDAREHRACDHDGTWGLHTEVDEPDHKGGQENGEPPEHLPLVVGARAEPEVQVPSEGNENQSREPEESG